MKIKLATTWDASRSSYWFVPCLMVGGAVLLSIATITLDSALPTSTRRAIWLYPGGAEGARTLLTMLATSMLTIFGVVFSIVIVALTLASSQFGPRMIRTFLSDTVDQIAVGTFISTFVYCLLVARTVRGESEGTFVPHVSVSVAILLAFPINQLVQLAVRALSPAINDLITAIMAIEHLRAGLCSIAERGSPPPVVADEASQERLLVKHYAADHHVDAAFNLIRQYGRENLEVTLSLLEAIEQMSRRTTEAAVRRALRNQATLVGNGARSSLPEQADRERVAERLERVLEVLQ